MSSPIPEMITLQQKNQAALSSWLLHLPSSSTFLKTNKNSHLSRRWSPAAPVWSSWWRGTRGVAARPSWPGVRTGGRHTPAWSLEEGRGCWAPTSACGRWAGRPEPSSAGRGTSGTAQRADVEIWGRENQWIHYQQDTKSHELHSVYRREWWQRRPS